MSQLQSPFELYNIITQIKPVPTLMLDYHIKMLEWPLYYYYDNSNNYYVMEGSNRLSVIFIPLDGNILELYYNFNTPDGISHILFVDNNSDIGVIQNILTRERQNIRICFELHFIDYNPAGMITKIFFYDMEEENYTEMNFNTTGPEQGYLSNTVIRAWDDDKDILLESVEYYCCILPERYFFYGTYPKFSHMMDIIRHANRKKYHMPKSDWNICSYEGILQRLLAIEPQYTLIKEHTMIFARTPALLNSFLSTYYEAEHAKCYVKLVYDMYGGLQNIYFGTKPIAMVFGLTDQNYTPELDVNYINKHVFIQSVLYNFINFHYKLYTNKTLDLKLEHLTKVAKIPTPDTYLASIRKKSNITLAQYDEQITGQSISDYQTKMKSIENKINKLEADRLEQEKIIKTAEYKISLIERTTMKEDEIKQNKDMSSKAEQQLTKIRNDIEAQEQELNKLEKLLFDITAQQTNDVEAITTAQIKNHYDHPGSGLLVKMIDAKFMFWFQLDDNILCVYDRSMFLVENDIVTAVQIDSFTYLNRDKTQNIGITFTDFGYETKTQLEDKVHSITDAMMIDWYNNAT